MDIKEFARLGGLASVKKRFAGKSKKEISQIMRDVRTKPMAKLTPQQAAEIDKRGEEYDKKFPISKEDEKMEEEFDMMFKRNREEKKS